MIHEMSHYVYKCMMLERSSAISNSAAHDISHNLDVYQVLVLTHSVWGTKLSLHLPSCQMLIALMEEQCAAQSHRSCAQVPV